MPLIGLAIAQRHSLHAACAQRSGASDLELT
jgi:hypothetical protein